MVRGRPRSSWRGWQLLLTRTNMFTLIAMRHRRRLCHSVIGTAAPNIFPGDVSEATVARFRSISEAAAVITVLVLLGQVLELDAQVEAISGAIKALLQLAPKTAAHRREHTDHEVEIDSLAAGDNQESTGEKVPVDGVILDGRSLDESLVTGRIDAGDEGARGQGDRRYPQSIRRLRDARRQGRRDTCCRRSSRWLRKQQRSRAPIQRLAYQVSGWSVPVVIRRWSLLAPGRGSTRSREMAFGLVAAVSVLIIACSCALGLATPMSIMVGVGRGGRPAFSSRTPKRWSAWKRLTRWWSTRSAR